MDIDQGKGWLKQGSEEFLTHPTKRETGKGVPTWNYAVVHAWGPVTVFDEPDWLREFVSTLTRVHEGKRQDPWAVTDAPADFLEKMVAAVVGIEISITELVGKWKVSQNRSISDRVGVADALEREATPSGAAVAALIRETLDGGD